MGSAIERYVIKHLSGSKANQVEEFDYSKNELRIGRAADSNIQFDPESDVVVSREHGKIVKDKSDPPEFSIVDNNSRNGIFINKNRVKGTAKLAPGDEVQLGNNGPVFVFDIFPRPQDMMMSTRVVEIPTSIKPTSISEVQTANVVSSSEPVKSGLGKQTVERMLVAERKKSSSKMAIVLGSLVLVLGILGFAFRSKLFPKPKVTIVNKETTLVDPKTVNKKTPDMIAKENDDKVVQIEFGWQLYDTRTSDELWHEFVPVKDAAGFVRYVALYIQNASGGIEPYLNIKRNVAHGVPVAITLASGSGFVVNQDGYILTNRHIGAGWNTRWDFANYAFPGMMIRIVGGKEVIDYTSSVMPDQVFGWVPANTSLVGGQQIAPGFVQGRNTYMKVIFSGTTDRREARLVQPSAEHDVALIKVDIPSPLRSVKIKDSYGKIQPGQAVTVMGYPGVAPMEVVVRSSKDPFNPDYNMTTMPTPTVTPGNVGRIIPASSMKEMRFSGFGDSYQLTINATGPGNSGGPMFDDEGNVIGIYYAGSSDPRRGLISFAVPIKYGLQLMSVTKSEN